METSELAEHLNPFITGHYERVYELLPDEIADGDLSPMKWALADTAFAIGVLAGAIFSGAKPRKIDRLERGLAHATASRHWQVRG